MRGKRDEQRQEEWALVNHVTASGQ
jgi:hypothetical protein